MDMKQTLFLMLSMLTFLAASVSTNAGKIFRWQDEAGTWHYSATPPAEQQAETINIKAPPTSGPVPEKSEENTSDEKNKGDNETQEAKPEIPKEFKKSDEVAAEDKALARKNCENARKNLANLTSHPRMRINDDETGEVRYLGQDEHSEWTKRSKEEISKYCQ